MKKIVTAMVCLSVISANARELTLATALDSVVLDGTKPATYELITPVENGLNWAVGETLTLSFDLAVTNPSYTWRDMSIGIGIGDGAQGIGFGIRHQGIGAIYWNAGIDKQAPIAQNFSINLLQSSDRSSLTNLNLITGSHDLLDSGDMAHFEITIKRTDEMTYQIDAIWADSAEKSQIASISRTRTVAIEETVDIAQNIMVRINPPTPEDMTAPLTAEQNYEFSNITITLE